MATSGDTKVVHIWRFHLEEMVKMQEETRVSIRQLKYTTICMTNHGYVPRKEDLHLGPNMRVVGEPELVSPTLLRRQHPGAEGYDMGNLPVCRVCYQYAAVRGNCSAATTHHSLCAHCTANACRLCGASAISDSTPFTLT